LRNLALYFVNWSSDTTNSINYAEPSAEKIPTEQAVVDYLAAHGPGATPTLQEVTEAGADVHVTITHNRNTSDVVRDVKNTTNAETVIQEFIEDDGSGAVVYADIDGNVKTKVSAKDGGFVRTKAVKIFGSYLGNIVADLLTTERTYQLPDASGTIALTSDIPSTPSLDAVAGVSNTITDKIVDVSKTSTNSKIWFGGNFIQFFKTNVSSRSTQVNFTAPTADHILSFPAKSGTLATTDDIPTYVDRFKGKYTSLSALNTARPTGSDGEYAIVDAGTGTNAVEYIWDAQEGWVSAASVGASSTDGLAEGSTNLYFTNGRALAAAPAETASSVGTLINGASAATPADADKFGFAVSSVLKFVTWANLKAAMLAEAVVGAAINGYTSKTTPVDADMIPLMDSADSNKVKKLSWANIKAALDSIYTSAARSSVIGQQGTDGGNAVGTAITYSIGLAVDPSQINAGDVLSLKMSMRRISGISNTITCFLYANTTNNLSGSPILIGQSAAASTGTYRVSLQRDLAIKVKAGTGTGTEALATAATNGIDTGFASAAAPSTLLINWTNTVYIIAAVRTTGSGDSACASFLSVSRS
jgi:hypothetical protein